MLFLFPTVFLSFSLITNISKFYWFDLDLILTTYIYFQLPSQLTTSFTCRILSHSILFYSITLHFNLFHSILYYCILFYSTLLYFILFSFVIFLCYILFNYIYSYKAQVRHCISNLFYNKYKTLRRLSKYESENNNYFFFFLSQAFASQCLYCVRYLGIPLEKVNPLGGAIALGHPLGCSGEIFLSESDSKENYSIYCSMNHYSKIASNFPIRVVYIFYFK